MSKQLEPLIVPLADITALTGQSRPVLHDAIAAGDLVTFLVGRRRFARIEAIRAWVDKLEEASNEGRPISYRSRAALGDKREQVAA